MKIVSFRFSPVQEYVLITRKKMIKSTTEYNMHTWYQFWFHEKKTLYIRFSFWFVSIWQVISREKNRYNVSIYAHQRSVFTKEIFSLILLINIIWKVLFLYLSFQWDFFSIVYIKEITIYYLSCSVFNLNIFQN